VFKNALAIVDKEWEAKAPGQKPRGQGGDYGVFKEKRLAGMKAQARNAGTPFDYRKAVGAIDREWAAKS
jgi:hypothetical protein